MSVREFADKSFGLVKADPTHPSLHFRKVGRFWSARVGLHHRGGRSSVLLQASGEVMIQRSGGRGRQAVSGAPREASARRRGLPTRPDSGGGTEDLMSRPFAVRLSVAPTLCTARWDGDVCPPASLPALRRLGLLPLPLGPPPPPLVSPRRALPKSSLGADSTCRGMGIFCTIWDYEFPTRSPDSGSASRPDVRSRLACRHPPIPVADRRSPYRPRDRSGCRLVAPRRSPCFAAHKRSGSCGC